MTKSKSPKKSRRSKIKPGEVYESAIDAWIGLLLFLGPIGAAAIAVYMVFTGEPGGASVMFAVAAATLIITVALTLPCRYTILDDALSVRCGLVVYQIPFDSIRSVEKSASLRSGPALSLRRVVIETDKKSHILSPKSRDEFLERLHKILRSGGKAQSG